MLNDAHISMTGYVATQPVFRFIGDRVPNLTMRVGWTPRRFDRATGEWVDGKTSYATVICWRRLADHGAICLRRGDPVVVEGRLSVRDYEQDGVRRNAVEVEASSIGHDLSRGVAQFARVRPQTGQTAAEYAQAQDGAPGQAGPADQPGLDPLDAAGDLEGGDLPDLTEAEIPPSDDPEDDPAGDLRAGQAPDLTAVPF